MNSVSRGRIRNITNDGNTDVQAYLDEDYYRCAMLLRSELTLVETLLKVSKTCLCPKLKTYADELHERRVKLKDELKIRLEQENSAPSFAQK
jgi:hypothetical protein